MATTTNIEVKEVLINFIQEIRDYLWAGEAEQVLLRKALMISMTNFQ